LRRLADQLGRLDREAWTTIGLLAASVAAMPLAVRALPAGDPFRGTLGVLPLVLAGLWAIARWTVRLGGAPLSRVGSTGELAALAVLILGVLARPALGLGRVAEALAAALLLVLAHRLARQVVAFRPLLGERLPRRPSILFFLLPLVAYLAILPWSTFHRQPDGDEPFYLLITHSLVHDFDAELTNNYKQGDWRHFMHRPIEPQPGDPVGPKGQLYSRHNDLLPIALVPAYWLAGRTGALAMMGVMTALLAWLTLRLARHDFAHHPGEALAAWALTAFTPPLLLYSYQVWVEVPAAILLVGALDRILDLDGRRDWQLKQWVGIGLSVLLLPLLKMRFLLVAGPLLAVAWWYAGQRRKQVLLLSLALSVLAGGMLLYNQILYSNPLKIHTWEEVDPHRYAPISFLKGGLGLLWDGAFGLFGTAPVWMVLLPAVLLLAVRRHRLLAHLAVLTFPYLVIVAPRIEWYGGWSPPFRYALIGLPLLGLALIPLFARRPGWQGPGARALLAGLGAVTLVFTLVWLTVPGWTYNFADGRTYALDELGERLGQDAARLFPSSIRPRPATWLWPPLTLVGVTLLWWVRGRRPSPPDPLSHTPSPRPGEGAPPPQKHEQVTEGGFPLSRGIGRVGGRGGQGVRVAGLVGIAIVLLAAATVPPAAVRLPTRVVEIEDPWVRKSGGHIYPDRWVIERARHPGGWVVRVGEHVEAPVETGGSRVRLVLHGQLVQNQPVPFRLDVRAGDRLLAVWAPARDREWRAVDLGTFDWPAGAPLVLTAFGPRPQGQPNGAVLDRVEFQWQE
jgi:hypothetical protein